LAGSPSLFGEENPIVPATAKLEKLWSEGSFTEGPAYGPGGCVYFSDIGNRIMKFDPATRKTSVYREPSGRANGLDFDLQGRLVAAEGANSGGNRRISITEKDGTVHGLAERWNGKRFNSPNDVTIDTKGRIYFTDPRYVGDEPREIDTESVYRVDPDGTVTQIITDVQKPNGIILSPDMKTLYLADSNPGGNQHLLAFALKPEGSVGPKQLLHDFGKERGIDGMSVDIKGNIYGAAGSGKTGGVYVFSPEGKQLTFIPTPETPTNCVFGDKDRKTLYITAGKSLYRIKLKIEGFAVYWPSEESKGVKPVHLENVNTDKDEDDPHLSSNGLHLYYTSSDGDKSEIREAVRKSKDRRWSAGQPVADINVAGDCRGVFLTPDGVYPQYLFFATNKDPEKKDGRGDNLDLYFLIKQRAKADFTTPTPLHTICSPADELHPWLTPDGRKLYFSRKDPDGWHVYVASRPATKGPFGKPTLIDLPAGYHHATLTPDGKTMYLQGRLENDRWGLFRSTWADTKWSEPEALSMLNNGEGKVGDLSPSLSRDGATLYFASDRPGGKGGLDLWMVPTEALTQK
jgi:gluconolactonase